MPQIQFHSEALSSELQNLALCKITDIGDLGRGEARITHIPVNLQSDMIIHICNIWQYRVSKKPFSKCILIKHKLNA